MTAIHKVQTKDLNEYSMLYGGQLLEWIDNYCFAKTEKFKKKAGERFVTKATNCEFLFPVFLGEAIQIRVANEEIKNTSIILNYEVISKNRVVAKGSSTFVKLYKNKPQPVT